MAHDPAIRQVGEDAHTPPSSLMTVNDGLITGPETTAP